MKVITLVENISLRNGLIPEHGLSLYIETEAYKILFDAGQSDAFIKNAGKLGLDLSQVDFAVLSHGHYDHGGGLSHFLQINNHAPVYLSQHAFGPHYNASRKYIGLDPELLKSGRLCFLERDFRVCENVRLHCGEFLPCPAPVRPFGLRRLEQDTFILEDFRHEIYMTIRQKDQTVLFSGCSHRGIVNIAPYFQPDLCFGGFHFSKLNTVGDDAGTLEQAAQILLASPTVYYTGHCTGKQQYDFLKQRMGTRLRPISCGVQVDI